MLSPSTRFQVILRSHLTFFSIWSFVRVNFDFVEYKGENNFVENIDRNSTCHLGGIPFWWWGLNPMKNWCERVGRHGRTKRNAAVFVCAWECLRQFFVVKIDSIDRNDQMWRLKDHKSFQTISFILRVKYKVYTRWLFFTCNITFLEKYKTFFF